MANYRPVVTGDTSSPPLSIASAIFQITITANPSCKLKRVDLLLQGVGYVGE